MKYLSFLFLSLGLVLFSCFDITDSGKDTKTNQSDGNDQISLATPLALGETAKLRIQSVDDVDYYAVNVVKGGVMNVALTDLPSIAIEVEIVNSEEKQLRYNLTSGAISNLQLPYLAKVGTYYIKIKSGSYEKSDKEFSIKVFMDTLDTLEWNNDRANAYPVTFNKLYRGTIFPVYDADYFKLVLDSNQVVRVTLDSISTKNNMNAKLVVTDFEGSSESSPYDVTSGELNTISYSLKAGTYYFNLSDAGNDAGSEVQYKLMFQKDTTDLTEWNDDTAHAYPIVAGDTVSAAIYPNADLDYFKITLMQADTIYFTIDSISSKLTSFQMIVYDKELSSKGYSGYSFNGNDGSLRYKKLLTAGLYYIKFNSGSSWDRQYSERRYRFSFKVGQ